MLTAERPASEHLSEDRTWQVYLVRCADQTLYCGSTCDLARRLAQHNGVQPGGARYTRGRRPVTLAAASPLLSRSEALRLEARVKRLPAKDKARAVTTPGALSASA